jgi:hypothetical protein
MEVESQSLEKVGFGNSAVAWVATGGLAVLRQRQVTWFSAPPYARHKCIIRHDRILQLCHTYLCQACGSSEHSDMRGALQ